MPTIDLLNLKGAQLLLNICPSATFLLQGQLEILRFGLGHRDIIEVLL